jgi:hypothetical protein
MFEMTQTAISNPRIPEAVQVVHRRATMAHFAGLQWSRVAFQVLGWLVCSCWMLHLASSASAGESSGKQVSIDHNKSVRSIRGNWWDHSSQSYVAPEPESDRDNAVRKTSWEAARPKPTNWRPPNLSWLGDYLKILAEVILVVLIVIGVIAFGAYFGRSYRPVAVRAQVGMVIDPARIEDLPFEEIAMSTDNPLDLARQLASQGRFNEAIIYLYGYQLLALDHSRKIHLHKGKTNRTYLRELAPSPALQQILETTVDRFETVYFGKYELSKQSFLQAWEKLDDFHSLLNHSVAVENFAGQANSTGVAGGIA